MIMISRLYLWIEDTSHKSLQKPDQDAKCTLLPSFHRGAAGYRRRLSARILLRTEKFPVAQFGQCCTSRDRSLRPEVSELEVNKQYPAKGSSHMAPTILPRGSLLCISKLVVTRLSGHGADVLHLFELWSHKHLVDSGLGI
jgi:hypothetical protein